MGMIANYQQASDVDLENIKNIDEIIDEVEEMQKNDEKELCDIDKMWDALHFLLTGKSADERLNGNLISEAILGQFTLFEDEIEEFIAGTKSARVKEIADALKAIDIEPFLEKFDMKKFKDNDIYPNIWDYEEEEEDIIDDLSISFENLRNFYIRMAEIGSAVLVSIY